MYEALAVLASSLLTLGASAAIELNDRNLRLDQIAETESDGRIIVARIPDGKTHIMLDAETARKLIRNHLPFADFKLKFDEEIMLVTRDSEPRLGTCYAASTAIPSGQIIGLDHVASKSCTGEPPSSAVGFDQNASVPYAKDEIAAGAFLGAIRPVTGRVLTKGESVALVTGSSEVRITRSVTTLQSGSEGGSVFVKASDGTVFSAPLTNIERRQER